MKSGRNSYRFFNAATASQLGRRREMERIVKDAAARRKSEQEARRKSEAAAEAKREAAQEAKQRAEADAARKAAEAKREAEQEDRARAAEAKPSARDCASAASTNTSDATKTAGTPRDSRSWTSCTLHDTQDPQSASASMTTSHFVVISWRRSIGAGLVKVGLA